MNMSDPVMLFAAVFAAAAATTIVATPIVRMLAFRLGAVAHPTTDRWHVRTVPLMGGLAVAAGALTSLGWHRPDASEARVIAAAVALLAVGLYDDFRGLKPNAKLLAQIAAACGVVFLGTRLHWTGWNGLDTFLTIFWIVGVTNAFNLLDNMDGLCAGIAAIAALALAGSLGAGERGAFIYCASLGGAAAGFLVFNFNPASVFMGDAGSLFIGSSLAVLTASGEAHVQTGVASALMVPVLLMLIPIFDTTFVTISRKLSARSASQGGKDHTSHRLVALGFTERQAVLLLYGLAATAGTAAIGLSGRGVREAYAVLALLIVGLVLLGVRLAKVKVYGGDDFGVLRDRPFTRRLAAFTYKRRLLEIILDACLIGIAYYAAYLIRFDNTFPVYYDRFIESLPLVIACQLACFFAAGVYRGVWRYIGVADLTTYVRGVAFASLTTIIGVVYVYRFERFSRGVFAIDAMVLFLLVVGSRLSFRGLGEMAGRYKSDGRPALIYGAGDAAALLVRELRNNEAYGYRLIGFLDDEPSKKHKRMHGLAVLGGLDDLVSIIAQHRVEAIILSSKGITPERLEALQRFCFESGTELKQMDFRLHALLPGTRSR